MAHVDPLLSVLSHRLLNHAAAVGGLVATVRSLTASGDLSSEAVHLLDLAHRRSEALVADLEHMVRGLLPPEVAEGASTPLDS